MPLRRGPTEDSRPYGREVPIGTEVNMPNEWSSRAVRTASLGPLRTREALPRPRPAFRKLPSAAVMGQANRPSILPRVSSIQPLVGESNRLLRPSFRRAYSSMSSPIASSSNLRIEDLDAMEMHAAGKDTMETRLYPEQELSSNVQTLLEETNHMDVSEVEDRQIEESPKTRHSRCKRVSDLRLDDPTTPGHMVRILKQAVRQLNSATAKNLEILCGWHDRFPEMRSTASYNVLLQYAYGMRNLRVFNHILNVNMPAAGIERDSTTWDLEMETYARRGLWRNVVQIWTKRQKAGVTMGTIGWTRLAQAVTRRGTTSLNFLDAGTSMSPIYSALYDLPKGVRQLQLHRLAQDPKMDVDQMLALMMPDDLHPMDFQATLVVAHRLAKQLRWRETEDVVALYLDRTAKTWEEESQRAAERRSGKGKFSSESQISDNGEDRLQAEEASARKEAGLRKQNALAFLHVLLECLVVSRSSPEMIKAYTDNYIIRYEATGVKPTYHTLYYFLSAYRIQPLESRFKDAYEAFHALEESYRPSRFHLADEYGLSRCLRQLQSYARSTQRVYRDKEDKRELLATTDFALKNIEGRLTELLPLNKHRDRYPPSRQGTRLPPWHLIVKEYYKAFGKRNEAKIQDSKVETNSDGAV